MYLNTPSYLLQMPLYPDWYYDARTGQNVQLVPAVVEHLYRQEQEEVRRARYFGFQAAHYAGPVQAQPQLISNHVQPCGYVNSGAWQHGSQQWAGGREGFGFDRVPSLRQVSGLSRQRVPESLYAPYGYVDASFVDARVVAGGYNAPAMQPVQQIRAMPMPTGFPAPVSASVGRVLSRIPAASMPASMPASNLVVDLTGDEPAGVPAPAPNSTTAAAQGKVASEVEPAPAPAAPTGPSAWTKGKKFLDKVLPAGSDSSRLFESMKSRLSAAQRSRFCDAHWPTEQAAHDVIRQMSR
ncbi:uncharacterized protein EKO05_0007641 [Ascochyta rabiei]|uniref:uncharacterized protein n=1 Tax=Didymella rabiei TaxID=5454 RepID=UPI002205572E|nr:uncharacterized protein EKO05_0007641 [Ascochyta rabiei]UPX17275.1 hypothetical protein EKO05_0007641 [Ascochyta rabiei]